MIEKSLISPQMEPRPKVVLYSAEREKVPGPQVWQWNSHCSYVHWVAGW